MSRGVTLLLAAVGVLVVVAAGAAVAVFVVLPSRDKTAATATTPTPTPAETPAPTTTPEPEPEPEPPPTPVSAEPVVVAPPPAPPPTTTPRGPSRSGGGEYCVQLGAFRVEGNAERLATAAHEQGVEVRILRIVKDGEPLFRVRTNAQPSRADAEATARHVADRMGIEGWVTRSRAT